jgi:hypothetical protein
MACQPGRLVNHDDGRSRAPFYRIAPFPKAASAAIAFVGDYWY